ncbi:MAG: AI-2E family transporter [Clostridiales bacterium]|nr:AI-2E family transporter [Clostridiales bacterium]
MEKAAGPGWRTAAAVAAGVWIAHTAGDGLLSALLPLFAAYVLARMASPSAEAVSRAFRVDRKIGGAAYAALLCFLALWFAALLSGKLIGELWSLIRELPEVASRLSEAAEDFLDRLPFERLTERLFERFGGESILPSLIRQAAGSVVQSAASALASLMQGFPRGALSLAVCGIGFVYLTADPDGAAKGMRALLPSDWARAAGERLRQGTDAVFSYLRGALLLFAVTFAELFAGLSLIGVENALAVAAVTAAVDFLPVFGCGTVLAPWAIVSFIGGHAGRGIALLVLLAVLWLVRQFLEPRVIGRAAGVHPFLALAGAYLGFRLAGPAGILLAPIVLGAMGRRTPGEKRS